MYMQASGNWMSVEHDGDPEDGLYVALYRENNEPNLIVGVMAYGEYMDYDATGEVNYNMFGWNYSPSNFEMNNGPWGFAREVVAYLPDNIDVRGLRGVREAFKVSA